MEFARLKWCCRRGMKELDVLLERYLDNCYHRATSEERLAFKELLELPDPELASFLLGRTAPKEPRMVNVVERIRTPN